MRDCGRGGLAIGIVERGDVEPLDGSRVQATRVDAESVGMAARHVEALDPAVPAEQMVRGAGVEGVFGQRIGALQARF